MTRLDALIIGGGPAGCSCAIWLKQLGRSLTLVERRRELGGLQTESPYPNLWVAGVRTRTGIEFARDLDAHVRSLEVTVMRESEPATIAREHSGFQVVVGAAGGAARLSTRHLVIATGVEPRAGGIPPAPGVIFGPGTAVDTQDFAGLRVAILGGGDNAAENYGFIARKSPARLLVFARHWRARPALLERVPEEARRTGDYRVDAARRVVFHDGREESFDRLVVLYGWQARIPRAVRDLGVEPDARGFVATDQDRRTGLPGVWAIGEVAQAAHPCCVTAMSDGVIAAKAIERAVEKAAGAGATEQA